MESKALDFFSRLKWIDGKPLEVEEYRRRIFTEALSGRYNLTLCGRGKKNYKSLDLILVALYYLLIVVSERGNQCYLIANDLDQANDDLDLSKKIISINPSLSKRVTVKRNSIDRRDGKGFIKILPAQDAIGMHGKTFLFLGLDEIHGYRNYDVLEAMAADPHRLHEAMTWITSYNTLYNFEGVPLHDMIKNGKAGTDPTMFFSWYAGDYCTDPEFASKPTPEERANPSILPAGYLDQQKRRLPSHKYRRLHLNLAGAPEGAYFSAKSVNEAIRTGNKRLPYRPEFHYKAFVDMSGGSSDDATLGISHMEEGQIVIDGVWNQGFPVPFNPRTAVKRFAGICKEYGISMVTGDHYAGLTYFFDFQQEEIQYLPCPVPKSVLYEFLEVSINTGSVSLPDEPNVLNQLLILITKGGKIDHPSGEHDDWANAAAGASYLCKTPVFTLDPTEDEDFQASLPTRAEAIARFEQRLDFESKPWD